MRNFNFYSLFFLLCFGVSISSCEDSTLEDIDGTRSPISESRQSFVVDDGLFLGATSYSPLGEETSIPVTGKYLPLLQAKGGYGLSILNMGKYPIEIRFLSLYPDGFDGSSVVMLSPNETFSGRRSNVTGSLAIYASSKGAYASRIYYTFITEH